MKSVQVTINITQNRLLIVAGLIIFAFSSNYLHAQWSGPSANPPLNNASTPINVSGIEQTKAGSLNLGGALDATGGVSASALLVTGGSGLLGNVGIGTASPGQKLEIFSDNPVVRLRNSLSGEYWDWTTTQGGSFQLQDDGITRFTIENDGNTTFSSDIGLNGSQLRDFNSLRFNDLVDVEASLSNEEGTVGWSQADGLMIYANGAWRELSHEKNSCGVYEHLEVRYGQDGCLEQCKDGAWSGGCPAQ